MSKQTIRPYLMLIYGLQDDYIATLKPLELESKGHLISPTISLRNDGTLELSFSIPMYYTDPKTGERTINTLWAATRNAEWLAVQRKIKIVFPADSITVQPDIFEFIITSKMDSHSTGELLCEIKGEGLAFRELGGTGYKLSLTQESFLAEYEEWAENPVLHDLSCDTNTNYKKVIPAIENGTPYAAIEKAGGKSVVWNQNYWNPAHNIVAYSAYGLAAEILNSGKIRLSGTLTNPSDARLTNGSLYHCVINHKYLIMVLGNNSPLKFRIDSENYATAYGSHIITANTENKTINPVFSAIGVTVGTVIDVTIQYGVIDLTQMFGAGNEPVSVDDERIRAIETYATAHTEYNSGEIISAKVTGIKFTGRNMWDGITGVMNGQHNIKPYYYNHVHLEAGTYTICYYENNAIKRVEGLYVMNDDGSELVHEYGNNTLDGLTFTIASDGVFFFDVYALASREDALDGDYSKRQFVLVKGTSAPTTFIPYAASETPFPAAIQALEGYGWSAGDVYNYVDFETKTFHKRVGKVDLGTLSWYYISIEGQERAVAALNGVKAPINHATKFNGLCADYNANSTWNELYGHSSDKLISVTSPNSLGIYNSAYTSSAEYQAALSGIYLYYELLAEEVIDISQYLTGSNLLEIESQGALIFQQNGTNLPIPSKVTYKVRDAEPVMSLDYWAHKVLDGTNWSYEVQMNWDAYPDIDTQGAARLTTKVYEDEYVSSWNDTTLAPLKIEKCTEKYRAINEENSNRYNITQSIAEAFGVYCKYKYEYDSNYHIVGRKVIFYNSYFAEEDNYLDITYPYNINEVKRTIEGTDVVTKMFVSDIEDSSTALGIISIADTPANLLKEDYILNFDYMKSIGSVSQEQLDFYEQFKSDIRTCNINIAACTEDIAKLKTNLVEYSSLADTAQQKMSEADTQINSAQLYKASLLGDTGTLTRSYQYGLFVQDEGGYRYTFTDDGVVDSTLEIYTTKDGSTYGGKLDPEDYELIKDEMGLVKKVIITAAIAETLTNYRAYFSYKYCPALKQDLIISTYTRNKELATTDYVTNTALKAQYQEKIATQQLLLDGYLEEKQELLSEFERTMGPVIKEGNWQDDDYADYGVKKQANLSVASPSANDGEVTFIWDTDLFDGEQENYYEEGVSQTKHYYPYFDITNSINTIVSSYDQYKTEGETLVNYLKRLSFYYTTHIIGSSLPDSYHTYRLTLGAGVKIHYIRENNTTKTVLLMTDNEAWESHTTTSTLEILNPYLGIFSYSVELQGSQYVEQESYTDILSLPKDDWATGSASTVTCFPRVGINSLLLKTNDDYFTFQLYTAILGATYTETLTRYTDYSILTKDDVWYLTLNEYTFFGRQSYTMKVYYALSNASTQLYLDALEVMKTNAFPQVSYEINPSKLPENEHKRLYNYLNRIVHINDADLFLDEVEGYISEVNLQLDSPWEDSIVIKDYKTKFEDLFSSISAAAATMASNGAAYDKAAAAFSVSGETILNEETIKNSINKYNLNYTFNSGTLTIDENNGIWARKEDGSGVVAVRGGGIFCATEKDAAGEWIWNTGIVPEGINANLITTGQLDTNHVRIFAGEDLALQLNAGGLFAYKQNADNTYDLNTYVVHNKDGLFFYENNFNKVELSWNGLKIRNNSGNDVFYADNNGNLMVAKAHIVEAYIDGLTVEEIVSPSRGIKLQSLSGTNYKYDSNTSVPTNVTLSWDIQSSYVTPIATNPWSVWYKYSENGSWIALNLASENCPVRFSNNLRLDIDYTILKLDGAITAHDVCYLKITCSCTVDATSESATYTNYLNVMKVENGAQGEPGATGATGATGTSVTNEVYYYQLASEKPDRPTNNTPIPSTWSSEEPAPQYNSDMALYYVVQTTYDNGDIIYSPVQQSSNYTYSEEIAGNLSQVGNFTEAGFSFTESAANIISGKVTLGTLTQNGYGSGNADMQTFVTSMLEISSDSITQKVSAQQGFSSVQQKADSLSAWVTDNTSGGIPITSILRFKSTGLHIGKESDGTVDPYEVNIANEGMNILRSNNKIARFRREQLTVSNIRIAAPTNDNINCIAIKESPDHGIMWLIDTAITE